LTISSTVLAGIATPFTVAATGSLLGAVLIASFESHALRASTDAAPMSKIRDFFNIIAFPLLVLARRMQGSAHITIPARW
jgi:hypothetical protein